jgi:hypothetical protein
MSEQTPGRRGSGAQIFNKILTDMGLRLTPEAGLPQATERLHDLDVTSLSLLDCVSDLMTNLAQLTSPDFDEQFNRAPLPLDKAGMLRLIEALHARGLLFIHAGTTPIDPAHLADVPDPAHTWVALTKAGAQAWEAHFQPDWNRLVRDDVSYRDDGMAFYEFVSPLRQQLEDIRQQIPTHASGVALETVSPLDMNYWKRFSQGYRLSFTLPKSEDWRVPAR